MLEAKIAQNIKPGPFRTDMQIMAEFYNWRIATKPKTRWRSKMSEKSQMNVMLRYSSDSESASAIWGENREMCLENKFGAIKFLDYIRNKQSRKPTISPKNDY